MITFLLPNEPPVAIFHVAAGILKGGAPSSCDGHPSCGTTFERIHPLAEDHGHNGALKGFSPPIPLPTANVVPVGESFGGVFIPLVTTNVAAACPLSPAQNGALDSSGRRRGTPLARSEQNRDAIRRAAGQPFSPSRRLSTAILGTVGDFIRPWTQRHVVSHQVAEPKGEPIEGESNE